VGKSGRFGKYGDLKRKEKIRQNRVQRTGPATLTPKPEGLKTRRRLQEQPNHKLK
jgi:hypothetical protein